MVFACCKAQPARSNEAIPWRRDMPYRTETQHESLALQAFLGLLDKDIDAGVRVQLLPDDLAQTMQALAHHGAILDEDFEDDAAF